VCFECNQLLKLLMIDLPLLLLMLLNPPADAIEGC
jgi:hypothetical protein